MVVFQEKAWKMENIVIKPSVGDIARSARESGKEEGEEKNGRDREKGSRMLAELGLGRKG